MADTLPTDAAGMISEARNFISELTTAPTVVGLTAAQITDLTTYTDTAENSITAQTAAESAKVAATADRKIKYAAFVELFRQLRQIAQAHPGTTDVDRARLRLATGEGDGKDENPLEFAPLIACEQAGVHEHLIRFFMPGEKSTSTKKPDGVFGAPIYMKIDGAATTNLKDYEMIVFDRKSPYNYPHEATDAGKTAHYICLWADSEDNLSPQSEVFSLVIT